MYSKKSYSKQIEWAQLKGFRKYIPEKLKRILDQLVKNVYDLSKLRQYKTKSVAWKNMPNTESNDQNKYHFNEENLEEPIC